MKYFLCSCYVLLFISTNSFAIDIGKLVLRDGVYYEQFSNITYTGWGEEKCTNTYVYDETIQFSGAIDNGIKNGVWNKYNCDYDHNLREDILYYEGRITHITEYHADECRSGRLFRTVACKKEERSYDRNDQLTGVFISYHQKLNLIKIKGNYRNGKKIGLWNEYNSSGVMRSQGSYNLDKKEGVWQYFFDPGMIWKSETYQNGNLEGKQTQYYSDGTVERIEVIEDGSGVLLQTYNKLGGLIIDLTYENGKKTGGELIFFSSGQLKSKGSWQDGRNVGIWESFNEVGQLVSKNDYDSNIEIINEYHNNGELKKAGSTEDGKPFGIWYTYDQDGRITKATSYEEDFAITTEYLYENNSKTPYALMSSDNILEFIDENGLVKSRGAFIKQMKQGLWEDFKKDGSIQTKTTYKDDVAEGPYEDYYTNGNLRAKGMIKNNEEEGLWEQYDGIEGYLKFERNYVKGKKEGLEKHFSINGEIIEIKSYKEDQLDGESIFYYSSTNEWILQNEWILMNTVRNLQNATEEANNWDQRIGIFKQDDLLSSKINEDTEPLEENSQSEKKIDTAVENDWTQSKDEVNKIVSQEFYPNPIVRIEPQYPREALIEGIEGYVVVEVTIGADGSVIAVRVLQSEPKRMFDRNVIRAVLKWKFKPRIINGVAVKRKAIQRLDFLLSNID